MARSRITIRERGQRSGRFAPDRAVNNDSRGQRRSEARIEQAITALGYVPSLAARSMGGGRSRLLLAVFRGAPPPRRTAAAAFGPLLLAGNPPPAGATAIADV